VVVLRLEPPQFIAGECFRERVRNPKVLKDQLSGHPNLYKIKLRTAGYRLVYEVNDNTITILVLSVGKRNRNEVYVKAFDRL
jgi:mRNA interferase RelE/StbE